MTISTNKVTLDFADGTYSFALNIGQLTELEEKCKAGLQVIFRRIINGEWTTTDVCETIRLGLIGGSTSPTEALRIVRSYVHGRPWAESLLVAKVILMAALLGVTEEDTSSAGESGPAMSVSTLPDSSLPEQ